MSSYEDGRYSSVGAAAVAVAPARRPEPRPRPGQRPSHLRVVNPAERMPRRLTPAVAVVLTAAVFATLLAVAVAHTLLVQGQVRLDRLDEELSQEQQHYQNLRRDVAELESPTRIVAAAQAQGMVAPEDLVYLQPPAPSTDPPPGDDEPAAAASPPVAADRDRAWSEVKPLLESLAP